MANVIGIAGASRNAAAALCRGGHIAGFAEEERLTRIKDRGLVDGALPERALAYLRTLDAWSEPAVFTACEAGVNLPAGGIRVDHHAGHATTAFASSSLGPAAVLVCDSLPGREMSLWTADRGGVKEADFRWHGPGLAWLYSVATEALGFRPQYGEHRVEALARLAPLASHETWTELATFRADHLELAGDVRATFLDAAGPRDELSKQSRFAARLQATIGTALLDLVRLARKETQVNHLCLGGGLFYNSYFTTVVARSGIFENVSVPVNPGNAGTAAGAALAVAGQAGQEIEESLSPFLGPEFDSADIKSVLDNCKLSYEYLSDSATVAVAVEALRRGLLLGWFQGRMEWGIRALGNRSILANPFSTYTLENLNRFLKRREASRPYSVSILETELEKHFAGPAASPFMEFEYQVRDRDRFRHMLPGAGSTIRVHSVADAHSRFGKLLTAFGELAGVPALVNTSFNGFHEPIVCTPRDAVRVFYGTGLDLAIIGNFLIRK
jgi:carbamoyltransferase